MYTYILMAERFSATLGMYKEIHPGDPTVRNGSPNQVLLIEVERSSTNDALQISRNPGLMFLGCGSLQLLLFVPKL
jgi:hypothetical protein